MFLIIVLSHAFQSSCGQGSMLYKENQDLLISVDVFASDRTVRGIIFSLLSNILFNHYITSISDSFCILYSAF